MAVVGFLLSGQGVRYTKARRPVTQSLVPHPNYKYRVAHVLSKCSLRVTLFHQFTHCFKHMSSTCFTSIPVLTDGFCRTDLVKHYCLLPKFQIHLFTRQYGVTLTQLTVKYQFGLHINIALRMVHTDGLRTEQTALGLTQNSVSNESFRRSSLSPKRKEWFGVLVVGVVQLGKWQDRGRFQSPNELRAVRVFCGKLFLEKSFDFGGPLSRVSVAA
jgi:hypothetical protein